MYAGEGDCNPHLSLSNYAVSNAHDRRKTCYPAPSAIPKISVALRAAKVSRNANCIELREKVRDKFL
jgi:hypothetical protein